jgi:hypothetical protein
VTDHNYFIRHTWGALFFTTGRKADGASIQYAIERTEPLGMRMKAFTVPSIHFGTATVTNPSLLR